MYDVVAIYLIDARKKLKNMQTRIHRVHQALDSADVCTTDNQGQQAKSKVGSNQQTPVRAKS